MIGAFVGDLDKSRRKSSDRFLNPPVRSVGFCGCLDGPAESSGDEGFEMCFLVTMPESCKHGVWGGVLMVLVLLLDSNFIGVAGRLLARSATVLLSSSMPPEIASLVVWCLGVLFDGVTIPNARISLVLLGVWGSENRGTSCLTRIISSCQM